MKITVNADDFGLSLGVNQAIYQGITQGTIHTTSLMVSAPFVENALSLAKGMQSGVIGLHFTLTNGKSVSKAEQVPLLVDELGYFQNGFLKLFVLSCLHPVQFRKQVALELDAQLQKMTEYGIIPHHIDGHRHIQMIPAVFKLVKQRVSEHNIPYLRIVNDSVWHTIKSHGDFKWLTDGGIIKWAVLKCFYIWNHTKSDTYFYSIFHTGRLFGKNVSQISVPKSYQACEVMIHPADIKLDTAPYPYPNPQDREQEGHDAGTIRVCS